MDFVGDVYVNEYLAETQEIASQIDQQALGTLAALLEETRGLSGRVFILGLGGSAANASHMAADLGMRAGVRAWAPESLPELTAWANDHGWEWMFVRWLESRDVSYPDMVLVLSVGGGGVPAPTTSLPLIQALRYANEASAVTAAIVGEPGGACAELADVVVQIPTVNPDRKTEHCEGWQGIIHHLIVSHPRLRRT